MVNKISESNVYLMMVYIDEFISNLHSHSPYCYELLMSNP